MEGWNDFVPLGLGYLAAHGRKHFPNTEYLIHHSAEKIIDFKPDMVGISYGTFSAKIAAEEARKIKEALGIPVFGGGIHITALPGAMDEIFDFGVTGEGEEAFLDMLRLWEAEGEFRNESLSKIPGLLLHDGNGGVVKTASRPFISDLDTITYPDRDLLHVSGPWNPKFQSLMTSRGCPYDCHFCSTKDHWGRKFRVHSTEYVVKEFVEIQERFNPKQINVFDDLFIVDKRRALEVLAAMRERGFGPGMDLRCSVRSNLLDDEITESLVATGFRVLMIGLESASPKVLDILNKVPRGAESHWKAMELARKHGALFSGSFILGAPGETREDLQMTFDFITSNADVLYDVDFSPLIIFPGTEVWRWGVERAGLSEKNLTGVVLEPEDFVDEKSSFMDRWVYLNEENMSREELYHWLLTARNIRQLVANSSMKRMEVEGLRGTLANASRPDTIAQTIPIKDIVKAKIKRRLQSAAL